MAKSLFALAVGLFLFGCAHKGGTPTATTEKSDCKDIAKVSEKKECACEQCKKSGTDCECGHKDQCHHDGATKKSSKKKK